MPLLARDHRHRSEPSPGGDGSAVRGLGAEGRAPSGVTRRTVRHARGRSLDHLDGDLIPKALPTGIRPMLTRKVDDLPEDEGSWAAELQLDGQRTLASLRGDIPVQAAVLDGELVVYDADGRSSWPAPGWPQVSRRQGVGRAWQTSVRGSPGARLIPSRRAVAAPLEITCSRIPTCLSAPRSAEHR